MKKFTLNDIWDWSDEIKYITINYVDEEDKGYPLGYIELCTESHTWIAVFDSSILNLETFPKYPNDDLIDDLIAIIDRPDDKSKGVEQ